MKLSLENYNLVQDDPQEYLSKGLYIQQSITNKLERIEKLKLLAESTTVALKPTMSSGSGPSKLMEKCVCEIIDLQNDLKDKILEQKMAILEIDEALTSFVPEGRLRDILEKRYLCGYNWKEIAAFYGCSDRWIHRLHARALETFRAQAI